MHDVGQGHGENHRRGPVAIGTAFSAVAVDSKPDVIADETVVGVRLAVEEQRVQREDRRSARIHEQSVELLRRDFGPQRGPQMRGRTGEQPEPYDGYYFRILTAQGPAAPGGAFSYLINGHMIAGHAMVAWPAKYGDSGVETFICGENGVVYQKDLGPNTAVLGASMAQYNPDGSWKVVE